MACTFFGTFYFGIDHSQYNSKKPPKVSLDLKEALSSSLPTKTLPRNKSSSQAYSSYILSGEVNF